MATEQLDLSLREDHAKVQVNPFTIAAKNKRVKQDRGPPPKTGLVSTAKVEGTKAPPRITLATQGTGNYHSLTFAREANLTGSEQNDRLQ